MVIGNGGRQPTMGQQQLKAQSNGFGNLFSHLHRTIGAIFPGQRKAYGDEVWYRVRNGESGVLTLLKALVDPPGSTSGLPFLIHADRTETFFGLSSDQLREYLPGNVALDDSEVRDWGRSTAFERRNAIGFKGYFTTTEQIDTFIDGLRQAQQKQSKKEAPK